MAYFNLGDLSINFQMSISGPDDMVQCPWCYGKIQGWEEGDIPLREHSKQFSSCPKFGERTTFDPHSLNVRDTGE